MNTKAENTTIERKANSTRPKNVLEAFERIVELAEDSNLSDEFLAKASTHIKYASRRLNLSKMQVVLLALFVDRSEDRAIRMSEIAKYVGCRAMRLLRLDNEMEVLDKKHYIRICRSSNCITYRVPYTALDALKKNIPYDYKPEPVRDTRSFFDSFARIMIDMDNKETTYAQILEDLEQMLEEIRDTHFARSIARMDLCEDTRALFVFMAHLYVENNDNNINFGDIENLYDYDRIPNWIKYSLRSRASDLFDYKLIENVNEDGMARSDCFRLTDFAKEDVLSELELQFKANADRDLINPENLAAKKLIYNAAEGEQVATLSEILTAGRFKDVQDRLCRAGMRPGFCCLFYGSPGTGKTETVYQIARATGRCIMRVDVDKIKSCWVGESEQNMKALFERYRNFCKNSELAPILLFNEADAVIGVRMEGATRAVDKMENSLQNIILQEMESLDGILIATTNLTSNLDRAFERRFLYKIQFHRPSAEARAQIWQAMLPGLTDGQAKRLAEEFDLSGGEIENIARKHTVDSILSGKDEIDIEAIAKACRSERLSGTCRKPIGFKTPA